LQILLGIINFRASPEFDNFSHKLISFPNLIIGFLEIITNIPDNIESNPIMSNAIGWKPLEKTLSETIVR
jgi:hypothetical protein